MTASSPHLPGGAVTEMDYDANGDVAKTRAFAPVIGR